MCLIPAMARDANSASGDSHQYSNNTREIDVIRKSAEINIKTSATLSRERRRRNSRGRNNSGIERVLNFIISPKSYELL